MSRPSDRAIAEAFWEWKAKLDKGNYAVGLIESRAAELDASGPQGAEPVACDVVRPDGALVAQRVDIAYADELLREWKWGDCHKANFLYAYKGETK